MAALFYRPTFRRSYALMLGGLLIDLDHLLADPIYDPMRCSVGFHPLHTILPIVVYIALLLHPRTRVIGIGLCIHIALDLLDCRLTGGTWPGA